MVALPRVQPPDPDALGAWVARVGRTGRLKHPKLARVLDVGEHERWPYAVYEREQFVTWGEKLTAKGLPGAELTQWSVQVLQGLAFAHEAGSAHRDLQPYSLLVDDTGNVKLLGLEIVDAQSFAQSFIHGAPDADGHQAAMDERRMQRLAAEIDVLAFGLVMHQVLAGNAPLDEPDVAKVVGRLPPFGHEMVRLPWTVPRPIAEPLRAIVNRATDRQERQRYRSARTFERALEGWLQASQRPGRRPDHAAARAHAQRRPAAGDARRRRPRRAPRAARDRPHARALRRRAAGLRAVVRDGAHGQLRAVAGRQQRQRRRAGDPPRDRDGGPRRRAPGGAVAASVAGPAQRRGRQRARRADAARQARRQRSRATLQPAGYDQEVVYLITALQNLGWLVVQYHFPDEAAQIRRLMQPVAAQKAGEPDEQGMTAEGASFAVLGIDIDALGAAVMHHWGLDDGVQHMVRRAPPTGPIHTPSSDVDMLRLVASCANDVLDAVALPSRQAIAAVQRVAQRYGRALDITLKDIQDALQPPSAKPDRTDA